MRSYSLAVSAAVMLLIGSTGYQVSAQTITPEPIKLPAAEFPLPASQLDQMIAWLDANCGPGFWAMAPSGASGVVNDAVAIYFRNAELARAFVNRWCIGFLVE